MSSRIGLVVYLWVLSGLVGPSEVTAQSKSTNEVNMALVLRGSSQRLKSVVTLAEAELSGMRGYVVLERTRVNDLLKEQKDALAGSLGQSLSIQAGRLLPVDLYVVFDDVIGEDVTGRFVVFDANAGIRLSEGDLSFESLPEDVERIAQGIKAAHEKAEGRHGRFYALSVFRVRAIGLPLKQNYYTDVIRLLMQRRLLESPSIAVLERDHLEQINEERSLMVKGGATDADLLASVVTLDIEIRPDSAGEGIACTALLSGVDGKRLGHLDVSGAVRPAELVDALTSRLLASLAAASPAGRGDRLAEADRYFKEAQHFYTRGRVADAARAMETAFALNPSSTKCRKLLAEYLAVWARASMPDLALIARCTSFSMDLLDANHHTPLGSLALLQALAFGMPYSVPENSHFVGNPESIASYREAQRQAFDFYGFSRSKLPLSEDNLYRLYASSGDSAAYIRGLQGMMRWQLDSGRPSSAQLGADWSNLIRIIRIRLTPPLKTFTARSARPHGFLRDAVFYRGLRAMFSAVAAHDEPALQMWGTYGQLLCDVDESHGVLADLANRVEVYVRKGSALIASEKSAARVQRTRQILTAMCDTVDLLPPSDASVAEDLYGQILDRMLTSRVLVDVVCQRAVSCHHVPNDRACWRRKEARLDRVLSAIGNKAFRGRLDRRSYTARKAAMHEDGPHPSVIPEGSPFAKQVVLMDARKIKGVEQLLYPQRRGEWVYMLGLGPYRQGHPQNVFLLRVSLETGKWERLNRASTISDGQRLYENQSVSGARTGPWRSLRDAWMDSDCMYVATSRDGLWVMPVGGGPVTRITTKNGLPSDSIQSLHLRDGQLYLGCGGPGEPSYLARYDLEAQTCVVVSASDRIERKTPLDGLTSPFLIRAIRGTSELDHLVLVIGSSGYPGKIEGTRVNGIWLWDLKTDEIKLGRLYNGDPMWASHLAENSFLVGLRWSALPVNVETGSASVLYANMKRKIGPNISAGPHYRTHGRLCGAPYLLHEDWMYFFLMGMRRNSTSTAWHFARMSARGTIQSFEYLELGTGLVPWISRVLRVGEQPPWTGGIEFVPEKYALLVCDETRLALVYLKDETPPILKLPRDVTITAEADGSPTATGKASATDIGDGSSVKVEYKDADMAAHMELLLRLDDEPGAATAMDTSKHKRHATVAGTIPGAAGTIGSCFSFNGKGDKLTVPHDPALNGKSMTVSAWARIGQAPPKTWQTVFCSSSSAKSGYELVYHPFERRWQFQVGGTRMAWSRSTGAPVVTGQWYHLVGTYDAKKGHMALYVDGKLMQSKPATYVANQSAEFVVGARDGKGQFFNGQIDDVSVWSRALTPDEVSDMHAAGLKGRSADSFLPPGIFRTWSATDSSGNRAEGVQRIIVTTGAAGRGQD